MTGAADGPISAHCPDSQAPIQSVLSDSSGQRGPVGRSCRGELGWVRGAEAAADVRQPAWCYPPVRSEHRPRSDSSRAAHPAARQVPPTEPSRLRQAYVPPAGDQNRRVDLRSSPYRPIEKPSFVSIRAVSPEASTPTSNEQPLFTGSRRAHSSTTPLSGSRSSRPSYQRTPTTSPRRTNTRNSQSHSTTSLHPHLGATGHGHRRVERVHVWEDTPNEALRP